MLTTSKIVSDGDSFPLVGHSILCSESVAECAPESTEHFADKNTRTFPSGLERKKKSHEISRFKDSLYILSAEEFF